MTTTIGKMIKPPVMQREPADKREFSGRAKYFSKEEVLASLPKASPVLLNSSQREQFLTRLHYSYGRYLTLGYIFGYQKNRMEQEAKELLRKYLYRIAP